jgi:hypothetical protein
MKIRGFEILVWNPSLKIDGKPVLDYRIEYGASPIRDKRSMDSELSRLSSNGVHFTVHPIA